MKLLLKANPGSALPIYVQLKEQLRHAVEVGALHPGDPLPPMRALAEELVVNANTVARVYRELEQEGLIELRHGVGAFISEFGPMLRQSASRTESVGAARQAVSALVARLHRDGLSIDAIRRLIDAELEMLRTRSPERGASRALRPDSQPARRGR